MVDFTSLGLTPAVINAALTGDNTIVAAVPGRAIWVWKMLNVVGAATNLTMKDGASTALTGAMPLVANASIALPFDGQPWFRTSPGNAFIINSSGTTVQQSGNLWYSLAPANVQP